MNDIMSNTEIYTPYRNIFKLFVTLFCMILSIYIFSIENYHHKHDNINEINSVMRPFVSKVNSFYSFLIMLYTSKTINNRLFRKVIF